MKLLENDVTPRFDLCFIDGAHSWFVDGFAFFLVDRLLVKGGWIVFDDLNWTYSTSPSLQNTKRVKNMPKDERTIAQVKQVYELLVKTHPNYGEFAVKDNWAYARKREVIPTPGITTEIVYVQSVADRFFSKAKSVIGNISSQRRGC